MEGAHVVSEFDNNFHVNNVLVLSNCYHGGNVNIHMVGFFQDGFFLMNIVTY